MSTNKSEYIMSLEKMFELAEFAKKNNVEEFSISGGEPLLHPDLYLLLNKCEELNLPVRIYTSGNYELQLFDELINKTSSNILSKITFIFSYPSIYSEEFKKLVGCTDEQMQLIDLNIKKSIKYGFKTEIHNVPNEQNVCSIYKTCKYLKEIGVQKVSFLNFVTQGRGCNNWRDLRIKSLGCYFQHDYTFDWEIGAVKEDLVDDNFQIRVGVWDSCHCIDEHICKAGFHKLAVRYDGIVFPCEAFKAIKNNEKFMLGNIYKNSMEEIWQNGINNEYLKILRDLKNKCGKLRCVADYVGCMHIHHADKGW